QGQVGHLGPPSRPARRANRSCSLASVSASARSTATSVEAYSWSVGISSPAAAGDTMQKVITPEQVDEYLSGTSRRYESFDPSNIGGSVTRAEDTSHLGSPRDLHDGLRLDYENTPFSPGDDAVRVIRFRSGEDGYVVPRNSDMGGSS